MTRNDAEDYAQRLYARVPANYRAYDEEQGQPLLALLELVGAQVANLRQDLDDLWDNFFIETCEDWVVPYLAALVGTNLLAQPIGQSNRLDVRNTIHWRRSKGTPAMLRALGQAISGWPTELSEFFLKIGWSQNMNHVRANAMLTVDVRDPLRLSRLGHADDPWAHAADIRPSTSLEQARITQWSQGVGQAAWGTPGRHQIKNLGFFVNRLHTFRIRGATPAATTPGLTKQDPEYYTFDPLFRNAPLFEETSRTPITRAAFGAEPSKTFGNGKDIAIRKFGILLAADQTPPPIRSASRTKFTFGSRDAGLSLDAKYGLRLMNPQTFQSRVWPFIVTATWQTDQGETALGSLNLLQVPHGNGGTYTFGERATGAGHLVITVMLDPGAPRLQGMLSSEAAHFPGAVLAIRAAQEGGLRESDGLYVYLPSEVVTMAKGLEFFVADDGSTYTDKELSPRSLARASEGQVYPARTVTSSTRPAKEFDALIRTVLPAIDSSRYAGAQQPEKLVIHAEFLKHASQRFLTIRVTAPGGSFVPATEVIIENDRRESLLVYLREIESASEAGHVFLVADDGSTFEAPDTSNQTAGAIRDPSFSLLNLARASAGQVLPIPAIWPLQQRQPVAIDLCRGERRQLLKQGQLGIDPELGRFAFPKDDLPGNPSELSVDYVEAFNDGIGARTFDRALVDPAKEATRRFVSFGRRTENVYPSVEEALAAVSEKEEIIEITDSATYAVPAGLKFHQSTVKKLTIRAARNQRPCLTFYQTDGKPTDYSLHINSPLESLELNGLLISGGPIAVVKKVESLFVFACTLDPLSDPQNDGNPSLIAPPDTDGSLYYICRSITGGLQIHKNVNRLTVADSIVDAHGKVAIVGPNDQVIRKIYHEPLNEANFIAEGQDKVAVVSQGDQAVRNIHLERVTVLGSINCDVLTASECILDAVVHVNDQQAGCIRFSRFESDASPLALPRRYECIPTDEQMHNHRSPLRLLAPLFNSRRFGRPDYLQLATGGPAGLLAASEQRGEIGAFTNAQNVLRVANLKTKLQEFLPAGLTALVLAET